MTPLSEDFDALDVYYELTRYRPWGAWSGDKLRGAIVEYGDPSVQGALRTEHGIDGDRGTVLNRALARLARDSERAKRERPERPRAPRPDPTSRNATILALMKPAEEAS